jgi:hypothetical protein
MAYTKYIERRLLTAVLPAVVGVVLLAGCNMFEPRAANPPGDDQDKIPWVPANDADGIFANLTSGIGNLDGVNYERTLADNFDLLPLDQDAIDLPGAFVDWTKQVEVDVLNLMLSESNEATVTFQRTRNINQSEYVQFRVEYELRLVAKANGAESVYKGIAEFDVRRNGGIWELELWREVEKVENQTTWGYLKGTLRLRLES